MVKPTIYRISGPVLTAQDLDAKMYDLVKVGKDELLGEVIKIFGNKTVIQVYEDTYGIKPGEPVETTGMPLSLDLGPGLLKSIYDGIQRPLPELKEKYGDFVLKGAVANALDQKKKWKFKATVKTGQTVSGGDIIGTVQETETIEHRVLVPPYVSGKVKNIESGSFTVNDIVCKLDNGNELKMYQRWPVRKPRPRIKKLRPEIPLISGQRILDAFFPIAKGGTAAIPGGFGTGKTVLQHQFAKWADADIVIFVGCGERGNEMTDVLEEFPKLVDPRTGKPLMERSVLVVNTSNMPVAAREASVYTGMTIAEYYRDQGYDATLTADSTSRWAEAMREVSSRLEEMPGEEGYPAYLAAKLSQFYERAGRVKCLGSGDRIGSVTAIGAVSPPGGDFSEPVTQNTLRVVKIFWALDTRLANRRHFPSINWLNSYSLYLNTLADWFGKNVGPTFVKSVETAMSLLQKEAQLQEIVQLVGADALPEKDRLILEVARVLREGFLQQSAFHEVDTYCELDKTDKMLNSILEFHELGKTAMETEVPVEDIMGLKSKDKILQLKYLEKKKFETEYNGIMKDMPNEFKKLAAKVRGSKQETKEIGEAAPVEEVKNESEEEGG